MKREGNKTRNKSKQTKCIEKNKKLTLTFPEWLVLFLLLFSCCRLNSFKPNIFFYQIINEETNRTEDFLPIQKSDFEISNYSFVFCFRSFARFSILSRKARFIPFLTIDEKFCLISTTVCYA